MAGLSTPSPQTQAVELLRSSRSSRARVAIYIAALAGINLFLVRGLFFAGYTANMQTNAGAFMAVSRFLLRYWPHVSWFPWWFNGEPFENSYSPLLNIVNAAAAGITGASVARAYNFVTALVYSLGPVFLFLFAWRWSRRPGASFCAALIYSLFSPANLLPTFRADSGDLWNPWRLRTLVYYGEGPHNAVVSVLPLVLLLLERALRTRRFGWCAASAASIGLLTVTNTFAITDVVIACACLIAVLPPKQMPKAALTAAAIGTGAYVWISPLMPPSLLAIIHRDAQSVEGDFNLSAMLPAQIFVLAGFVCLWFATLDRIRDRFTRFCWLFGYVLFAITAFNAYWKVPMLPQPHRYSLEMELAVALAAVFTLRGLVLRMPVAAKAAGVMLCAGLGAHQMIQFESWSREHIQPIDIAQTPEFQSANWIAENLPGERIFAGGETATWLDAFADIPQMHSGHEPANPNWTEQAATFALYSDQNAGDRAAEVSLLWLKAFGCHAILIGPSRYYGDIFAHAGKFDGVLPVLFRTGRFTLYGVPERTESLAHVVPKESIVADRPINALDTEEVERYVGALEDARLPDANLTWSNPSHGWIETTVHPGEAVSVQTTYDKGWVARVKGREVKITRDGIGLMALHPGCDGPCRIELSFELGWERRLCWIASGLLSVLIIGRSQSLWWF